MSLPNNYSIFSDKLLFYQLTTINSLFTLFSCLVAYIPVFPIFVYVFRKNRDIEMTSNVYPILNHFYRTIIFEYSYVAILLIVNSYVTFHPEFRTEHPTLDLMVSQMFDFHLMFFEIHHLIIILLAVQRFVLYFQLPVKADFSPKAVNIILFALYFVGYLKLLIFEVSMFVLNDETMNLVYLQMLAYETIVIHVLLFASAILYIPISVSIRRKAHLVSIIKNKPDRFILYQTFGLAAFKVASLRLQIFYQFEAHLVNESHIHGNTSDFYTTPVMIQMSYLFSNKRNLDTIKNIFKRRNRTVPSIPISAAQASSMDN